MLHSCSETLTSPDAMTYIFKKHNVYPGYQTDSIEIAIRNLFGLHAARLPTPYVSLFSRVNNMNTTMLWDDLYLKKTLIKLRCMRKTLHILPLDFAEIAHHATINLRLNECSSKIKKMNVSDSLIQEIGKIIVRQVKCQPTDGNELINIALQQTGIGSERRALVSLVIKELWEKGILCYINNNKDWGKESRVYGFTKHHYSRLNIDEYDIGKATDLLVYYYIKTFGPVTEMDMYWWTGLSRKSLSASLSKISSEIMKIKIDERPSIYYMNREDFEKYLNENNSLQDWVTFLAYEDPTLKGYFESRYLYVNSENYNILFNSIGEVRSSIIINGRVEGIWYWDKKHKKIEWQIFSKQSMEINSLIKEKIIQLGIYLGYNQSV